MRSENDLGGNLGQDRTRSRNYLRSRSETAKRRRAIAYRGFSNRHKAIGWIAGVRIDKQITSGDDYIQDENRTHVDILTDLKQRVNLKKRWSRSKKHEEDGEGSGGA